MKLVSIETIPGQNFEVLGVVKGTIVQSKNFGKDFMAAYKCLHAGHKVLTKILGLHYSSFYYSEHFKVLSGDCFNTYELHRSLLHQFHLIFVLMLQ